MTFINSKGTRIYSVSELNEINKRNLENLPILIQAIAEARRRNEICEEKKIRVENTFKDIDLKMAARAAVEELYMTKEKTSLQNNEEVISNHTTDSNNPYGDLKFGDRIEITEVLLFVSKNNRCSSCGKILDKSQIILKYDRAKRYSFQGTVCVNCKRIYVDNQKLQQLKKTFKQKHISLHIERA